MWNNRRVASRSRIKEKQGPKGGFDHDLQWYWRISWYFQPYFVQAGVRIAVQTGGYGIPFSTSMMDMGMGVFFTAHLGSSCWISTIFFWILVRWTDIFQRETSVLWLQQLDFRGTRFSDTVNQYIYIYTHNIYIYIHNYICMGSHAVGWWLDISYKGWFYTAHKIRDCTIFFWVNIIICIHITYTHTYYIYIYTHMHYEYIYIHIHTLWIYIYA